MSTIKQSLDALKVAQTEQRQAYARYRVEVQDAIAKIDECLAAAKPRKSASPFSRALNPRNF